MLFVGVLAEPDVRVAAAFFLELTATNVIPLTVTAEGGLFFRMDREQRRSDDCRAKYGGENLLVPFLCQFHK